MRKKIERSSSKWRVKLPPLVVPMPNQRDLPGFERVLHYSSPATKDDIKAAPKGNGPDAITVKDTEGG